MPDYCSLTVNFPTLELIAGPVGPYQVFSSNINSMITQNAGIPDVNYLYKMVNTGTNQVYYFRQNSGIINSFNQIVVSGISWYNDEIAPPGNYYYTIYQDKKPIIYNKSMCMIGDSITAWNQGKYFRCQLLNKGLQYDFIGSKRDANGYAHEGIAGNTSLDVYNRISTIPIADSYFLLIGINDMGLGYKSITSAITIEFIVKKLLEKNPTAQIYISTILPIANIAEQTRVFEINYLLNSYNWKDNVHIIDLGYYMYNQLNWSNLFIDGVHPNLNGYNIMTDYLSTNII